MSSSFGGDMGTGEHFHNRLMLLAAHLRRETPLFMANATRPKANHLR